MAVTKPAQRKTVHETHLISLWHVQLPASEMVGWKTKAGRYQATNIVSTIFTALLMRLNTLASRLVISSFPVISYWHSRRQSFRGWLVFLRRTLLQKYQLADLLEIATTNQLFQFNGELHEQTDGVAMDSPLGSLLANVFMCHVDNQLEQKNMIPSLCRRYVDNTSVTKPNTESATDFLQVQCAL